VDSLAAGHLLDHGKYLINLDQKSSIINHFSREIYKLSSPIDIIQSENHESEQAVENTVLIRDDRFSETEFASSSSKFYNDDSQTNFNPSNMEQVHKNNADLDEFDLQNFEFDNVELDQFYIEPITSTTIEVEKVDEIENKSLHNSVSRVLKQSKKTTMKETNIIKKYDSKRLTNINDPDFIDNYYSQSRLHMISIWREELKRYASQLMEEKNFSTRKSNPLEEQPKITEVCDEGKKFFIMHIDMDCFFASVSLRERPDLANKPVGITHASWDKGATKSGSDLACCNYLAREHGLCNGMYVKDAVSVCPDLILLPYSFEKYRTVSFSIYRILARHASKLYAISCDEAYIAVESIALSKSNGTSICHNDFNSKN
jgi:hypothetical protein